MSERGGMLQLDKYPEICTTYDGTYTQGPTGWEGITQT